MTLTPRDRKIVFGLIPVALLLAVWFLVLAPQRAHVSSLSDKLTTVEAARDGAVIKANTLRASKDSYAQDYTTVVRLGKAIPQDLDMASLLVQLETAAKGTGIDFDSITAGARTTAPTAATTAGTGAASGSTPAAGSSSGGSSSSSSSTATSGSAAPPAAAGGQPAQSGAGQAAEKANGAASTSNSANQAAGASSSAAGATATGPTTASTPGLDTVPLTFDFKGSYFDLADFFHRVKRFVRVAGPKIEVRGRLMAIDGVTFNSDASSFPVISAQVNATVYLSPKSEGTTAGGTSAGPTATPTSGSTTSPATPSPAASTSNTGAAQ